VQLYWLKQSEADVPPADDWLSGTELATLSALRFPKRRADWRLGRWTAKCAVAATLQLANDHPALREIIIRAAATGAPEVEIVSSDHAVTISISHREGLALCAVAQGKVALGCDLEIIEPKSAAFFVDYFTREEQELVTNSTEATRPMLASLIWSAKESALKALHIGLRADTRSAAVDPLCLPVVDPYTPHWYPLLVRWEGASLFHGWWRCIGSVVYTVAAAPPPREPISLESNPNSPVPSVGDCSKQEC
jgi:4'-phosphopantetheinyl transferase